MTATKKFIWSLCALALALCLSGAGIYAWIREGASVHYVSAGFAEVCVSAVLEKEDGGAQQTAVARSESSEAQAGITLADDGTYMLVIENFGPVSVTAELSAAAGSSSVSLTGDYEGALPSDGSAVNIAVLETGGRASFTLEASGVDGLQITLKFKTT